MNPSEAHPYSEILQRNNYLICIKLLLLLYYDVSNRLDKNFEIEVLNQQKSTFVFIISSLIQSDLNSVWTKVAKKILL